MLGCTAFGGPVAHIGYFQRELVERRRWIDETGFADLLALCQFLPGPASSQLGFALGLRRAGGWGGAAAWAGFTLPSAVLMTIAATGLPRLSPDVAGPLVHGLKLAAVAVVAQALWAMARNLTPDAARLGVALLATSVAVLLSGPASQIAAIAVGAACGLALPRRAVVPTLSPPPSRLGRRRGLGSLTLFVILLLGLPLAAAATGDPTLGLVDAVYRAGALVFGGGHVVLPLLEQALVHPGGIGEEAFLAGYGAAQAMPGPLFTFAAYLGALAPPGGPAGAALALAAIFLPGLLLVGGVLPFWSAIRTRPTARSALDGANAAVVGVLALALYDPVWTGGVTAPVDALVALAGFILLQVLRAPPILVVAATVAAAYGLPALA